MTAPPAFVEQRPLSDRLFDPHWAGGWFLCRWLWVLAAILEHGWRVRAIEDAYAAQDMIFNVGIYRVASYIQITHTMGYALWGGTMVGILMVAWGGRLMKPGLVLFMVCGWTLGANEGLNVKAHDRLLVWVTLGLLLSPAGERGLFRKYRSPVGRHLLLIVFAGVYGSTGFAKVLYEPSWLADGLVLGLNFLDQHHGSSMLGVWMSDKTWILWPSTVITVFWECTFPLAIWFKRLNPWYLLVGMMFHLILLATMQVGPFAFVSMAVYPVLLHPELAREWTTRARRWWRERQSARSAVGQGGRG